MTIVIFILLGFSFAWWHILKIGTKRTKRFKKRRKKNAETTKPVKQDKDLVFDPGPDLWVSEDVRGQYWLKWLGFWKVCVKSDTVKAQCLIIWWITVDGEVCDVRHGDEQVSSETSESNFTFMYKSCGTNNVHFWLLLGFIDTSRHQVLSCWFSKYGVDLEPYWCLKTLKSEVNSQSMGSNTACVHTTISVLLHAQVWDAAVIVTGGEHRPYGLVVLPAVLVLLGTSVSDGVLMDNLNLLSNSAVSSIHSRLDVGLSECSTLWC